MQNKFKRQHFIQTKKREFVTILPFVVSLLLALFLFPQLVVANSNELSLTNCQVPEIEKISKPINELVFDSSKPSSNNLVIWNAHIQLAEKIWNLFESGQLQKNNFNISNCLQNPLNDNDLMLATNDIFLQKTFQRLKNINPQMYLGLNQKIDFNQIVFQAFAFCEACQMQSKKLLGEKPAGYNLTTQALFLNIQALSPEDWDVIFIHELGHHFDPTRKDSKQYFNIDQVKIILELQKKYDRGESLVESEMQQIDQWIENGINIGLLAEWRVWSFTLQYLDQVSNYQFGEKTKWLQAYKNLSSDIRYIELFKTLDRNFTNPTTGLPSHPLVFQRVQLLRSKIRTMVMGGQIDPLSIIKNSN